MAEVTPVVIADVRLLGIAVINVGLATGAAVTQVAPGPAASIHIAVGVEGKMVLREIRIEFLQMNVGSKHWISAIGEIDPVFPYLDGDRLFGMDTGFARQNTACHLRRGKPRSQVERSHAT